MQMVSRLNAYDDELLDCWVVQIPSDRWSIDISFFQNSSDGDGPDEQLGQVLLESCIGHGRRKMKLNADHVGLSEMPEIDHVVDNMQLEQLN